MPDQIASFDGEYRWLSNFYVCPVTIYSAETGNGVTFGSSEAAYQAAKCPERMMEFVELTPGAAKRLGQEVELRSDWDDAKDEIMFDIVYAKFYQNPDLAEKLIGTGDANLIEGNTWGDRYWGVCDGEGRNQLGKTLMRVREILGNAE